MIRPMTLVSCVLLAADLVAAPLATSAVCTGACEDPTSVGLIDILKCVNIVLGNDPLEQCPSLDANHDGVGTVDELLAAVINDLDGCPLPFDLDVCNMAPVIGPDLFHLGDWLTSATTTNVTDPSTSCGCGVNSHSAWFAFSPVASGVATISTVGSNYDTVLAVFTGTCGALTEVTCNDDAEGPQSRASLPVTGGTSYMIEVTSHCNTPAGELHVSIDVCGDGMTTEGEECDDGNLIDGDGCDSHCRFEGLGGIDQSWTGPQGLCGSSTGGFYILPEAPVGQEFKPTRSPLAAVDIVLFNSDPPGEDTLTLNLRKGTISAPVVASTSARVTSPGQFWQHFTFSTPAAVVPNEIYVLELVATQPNFGLVIKQGFVGDTCTLPSYPDGKLIDAGTEMLGDALFRTYAGSHSTAQ